MLTLSKQADYGLLLLSLLNDKKVISLSQLIEKTKLPKRFLARIAARLAEHKIVESKEGRMGGYKLNSNIDKITFYDYLKIFEGELNLIDCDIKKTPCGWDKICSHKYFLKNKLKKRITEEFKKYRLIDLI